MLPGSPADDSESDDEETILAGMAAAAERGREEYEETMRRRRAAFDEYENGRFRKVIKMEPDNLSSFLEKATVLLPREEKEEFDASMMEVVSHFELSVPDYLGQIGGMTDKRQLVQFIKHAHKQITTESEDKELEENLRRHNFLAKFQKPIVAALREMTKIPKDVVMVEVEAGNVFVDARMAILSDKILEAQMERLREIERIEMEKQLETKRLIDTINLKLFGCHLDDADDDTRALAKEFAAFTFQEMQDLASDRPTSPTRFTLSDKALVTMDRICNKMKVNCSVRDLPSTSAVPLPLAPSFLQQQKPRLRDYNDSSDSEDDGDSMFAALLKPRAPTAPVVEVSEDVEDMEADYADEDQEWDPQEESFVETKAIRRAKKKDRTIQFIDGADVSLRIPQSSEQTVEEHVEHRIEEHSYDMRLNKRVRDQLEAIESEQQSFFTATDRATPYFQEYLADWRKQRAGSVIRKKTVSFAPFESPMNRMRIFMKPNMIPSRIEGSDQDDGPNHHWKEYDLKEGWDELQNRNIKLPLVMKGQKFVLVTKARKTTMVQKLTLPLKDWMIDVKGNVLGRFWFLRDPEYVKMKRGEPHDEDAMDEIVGDHDCRRDRGLLRQYTQDEIHVLLNIDWNTMKRNMRRGIFRQYEEKGDIRGAMSSVLILTDWRLIHLDQRSVHNAVVRFMPTQIGPVFFQFMDVFLRKLLLDVHLEITTIIFAFGGSPLFKIEDFKDFWKKLIMLTLKCVDVHWFAQDWLDGLKATEQHHDTLNKFNAEVKEYVERMRKVGNINYHWHNLRKCYNIPLQDSIKQETPDTIKLESLYNYYIRYFVAHCNVVTRSAFFSTEHRKLNEHPKCCSLNPVTSLVYKLGTDREEDDMNDDEEKKNEY